MISKFFVHSHLAPCTWAEFRGGGNVYQRTFFVADGSRKRVIQEESKSRHHLKNMVPMNDFFQLRLCLTFHSLPMTSSHYKFTKGSIHPVGQSTDVLAVSIKGHHQHTTSPLSSFWSNEVDKFDHLLRL